MDDNTDGKVENQHSQTPFLFYFIWIMIFISRKWKFTVIFNWEFLISMIENICENESDHIFGLEKKKTPYVYDCNGRYHVFCITKREK